MTDNVARPPAAGPAGAQGTGWAWEIPILVTPQTQPGRDPRYSAASERARWQRDYASRAQRGGRAVEAVKWIVIGVLGLALIFCLCPTCYLRLSDTAGAYYSPEKECPIESSTKVGEMKNGAPVYIIEPGDC